MHLEITNAWRYRGGPTEKREKCARNLECCGRGARQMPGGHTFAEIQARLFSHVAIADVDRTAVLKGTGQITLLLNSVIVKEALRNSLN